MELRGGLGSPRRVAFKIWGPIICKYQIQIPMVIHFLFELWNSRYGLPGLARSINRMANKLLGLANSCRLGYGYFSKQEIRSYTSFILIVMVCSFSLLLQIFSLQSLSQTHIHSCIRFLVQIYNSKINIIQ